VSEISMHYNPQRSILASHSAPLLLTTFPLILHLLFSLVMHMLTEVEGLRRKLTSGLSPVNPQLQAPWDIGECVATYYR
jgi:hypothetical protein